MNTAERTNGTAPGVRWLEEHGDALYRYALARVRDPDVAEDLVQETLLAALAAQRQFAGLSGERTWLTGILRHKLVDHLRKSLRQRPLTEVYDDGAVDLFDGHGTWRVSAAPFHGEPRQLLERAEFRAALANCLSRLPRRIAQLFWLREAEGMGTDELCQELNISPTNAWAMLHRARLRLRQCLGAKWFDGGGA